MIVEARDYSARHTICTNLPNLAAHAATKAHEVHFSTEQLIAIFDFVHIYALMHTLHAALRLYAFLLKLELGNRDQQHFEEVDWCCSDRRKPDFRIPVKQRIEPLFNLFIRHGSHLVLIVECRWQWRS
jgi:hypothetical protein